MMVRIIICEDKKMKITNKFEMSFWALTQCLVLGNDSEDMRNLITEKYHLDAYNYYKEIKGKNKKNETNK